MFPGFVFLCLAFLHFSSPETLGQSPESPKFPPGRPEVDGGWNLPALHTAKNAGYLKDLEKQVILELNKVRSDPPRYTKAILFPQRRYYVDQKLIYPGEIPILTREGVKAFDECCQALLKARSAGLLTPKEGLTQAARDHAVDQGNTGQTGHTGMDRSDVSARANRHGKWGGKVGENIQYGHASAARIVSSLLIDDGVPSRGHRKIIMEPLFRYIGVAFGPHPKFRYMCVLVFAAEYTDSGIKSPH